MITWFLSIPEAGDWRVPYTGRNEREARKAARRMLKRALNLNRLPNGSYMVMVKQTNKEIVYY